MTAKCRPSVRPSVEILEDRRMLSAATITDHGGFVQHTGNVEAIYYGQGWTSSEKNLENSIQAALQGVIAPSSDGPNSYLSTLQNAGYGAFNLLLAGSTNTSPTAQVSPANIVTDQDVQNYLTASLNSPYKANQATDRVEQDTAQRVYLVVVDANDRVQDYNGNQVSSYHRSFSAIINGSPKQVNYAVIAVSGGNAANPPISSLLVNPQLDSVTANASRELIDALTNPAGFGWHAGDAAQTEIGDSGVYAYVNNDLVVRPLEKHLAWMLPAQAAAPNSATFILDNSGNLWERSIPQSGGLRANPIFSAIAQSVTDVSDQGIDINGRAMIDYLAMNPVTHLTTAYEFHDGAAQSMLIYSPSSGATSPLGIGQGPSVVDAKAGQGVSYVLLTSGSVWEFNDLANGVLLRDQGVTAIDAGTNTKGVNMVDVIRTRDGQAVEIPDQGRAKVLKASGVVEISAGRQGRSAMVDGSGNAWLYDKGDGLHEIAVGISSVASGFDANGDFVVDLVSTHTFVLTELDYTNGSAGKLKPNPVLRTAVHHPAGAATPVATLAPGGVISKMRAGVLDMAFTDGVFEGTIDGAQQLLGNNLQRAV